MGKTSWLRRITTVALGAPIVISAITHDVWFCVLVAAACWVAAMEYAGLVRKAVQRHLTVVNDGDSAGPGPGPGTAGGGEDKGHWPHVHDMIACVSCSCLAISPVLVPPTAGVQAFPVAMAATFGLTALLYLQRPPSFQSFLQFLAHVSATVVVALPLAHGALLRMLPHGVSWVVFTVACVWNGDNGALLVGKAFGSRSVFPVLSPHKTLEGLLGAVTGSVLTAAAVPLLVDVLPSDAFPASITLPQMLLLGLQLGVLGILGDLMESSVKRAAGADSSGSLLPGHGGVFDRIDSLLLALPFAYFVLSPT